MYFPKLYFKTPFIEEKIKLNNKTYLVNTRIDIIIYNLKEDEHCAVISKDIVFRNGHSETVLLKYINNVKRYDDVLDLVDEFMSKL